MPTIQIEAHLTPEQLLSAARQMSRREFQHFVEQVLSLRAEYGRAKLPAAESELLLKINQPVPPEVQYRYEELLARRDDQMLSDTEQQELLALTDQVELLEAERMKHLLALAELRQVSLDAVMQKLGLQPLAYA